MDTTSEEKGEEKVSPKRYPTRMALPLVISRLTSRRRRRRPPPRGLAWAGRRSWHQYHCRAAYTEADAHATALHADGREC